MMYRVYICVVPQVCWYKKQKRDTEEPQISRSVYTISILKLLKLVFEENIQDDKINNSWWENNSDKIIRKVLSEAVTYEWKTKGQTHTLVQF